jgi:hypothetical protein
MLNPSMLKPLIDRLERMHVTCIVADSRDPLTYRSIYLEAATAIKELLGEHGRIQWFPVKNGMPKSGKSYLVRMTAGVLPPSNCCYEVGFYKGAQNDGAPLWIVGGARLRGDNITHWAGINEP